MLSYREKQLLASMKYNKSESDKLSDDLKRTLEQMEQGQTLNVDESKEEYVPAQNMDDLYERAKAAGYDSWTRASDILTPEEIADLQARKKSIEAEFNEKVKLRKEDYAFLFSAVLLQLGKQIILKYDFFQHTDVATKTEKKYKKKYDKRKQILSSDAAKRYYAPFQQITMTKFVPYDIVSNAKHFGGSNKLTGLSLNGDNHRFKSVGHDPILGLYFGTANILTNTATFYPDPENIKGEIAKHLNFLGMVDYHVRYKNMSTFTSPYISSYASGPKIGEYVIDRIKYEPKAFLAALGKEIAHIGSDQGSVCGIPVPFASQILGAEMAEEWALKGIDWSHFLNIPVFEAQVGCAIAFNAIISTLHRVFLLWGDLKESNSLREAVERFKTGKNELLGKYDDIRTRKIIMYSNSIASTINLAVCTAGGAISAAAGNAQLSKEMFSHLDIGGLMITLFTLFHDGRYILKIKDDFIKATINADFEKMLKEIENGTQIEL